MIGRHHLPFQSHLPVAGESWLWKGTFLSQVKAKWHFQSLLALVHPAVDWQHPLKPLLLSGPTPSLLMHRAFHKAWNSVTAAEWVNVWAWAVSPAWLRHEFFWKKLDSKMFQPYRICSAQLGIHSWITSWTGCKVRAWLRPPVALESSLLRSDVLTFTATGRYLKAFYKNGTACCNVSPPIPTLFSY